MSKLLAKIKWEIPKKYRCHLLRRYGKIL